MDNLEYGIVNDWEYYKGEAGEVTIIFNEPVETRFIKVKSYFDERDEDFEPVNKAEFTNTAEDLINVYYYVTDRLEEYDYDAGGNRVKAIISQRYSEIVDYEYYTNSSRLKSNGKYAYVYDDNGNLTEKGTDYTISGDNVTIDPEGKEYWEYEYDLLDRLISVKKNGTTVANYTYNHKGLRIKKENVDTSIYYVFNLNDNIVYEQENSGYSEYIYVGGQHFARVDGELLSTETTTYFYHTDHLGSTVLVTNASADIVWNAEYTPFGNLAMEEGKYGFQKARKFTGKDLDEDTGLYYYNARWYDAEIGRFISEDPIQDEIHKQLSQNDNNSLGKKSINGDGINKNGSEGKNNIAFDLYGKIELYVYGKSNPIKYIDPDGKTSITANYYMKKYSNEIKDIAEKYNITESLLFSVVWNENKYRNNIHLAKDIGGLLLKGNASLGLCQVQMTTAAYLDTNPESKSISNITHKEFESIKREAFDTLSNEEKSVLQEKLMYNDIANIDYAAKYLSLVKEASGHSEPKILLSNYNRSPNHWNDSPNDYGDAYREYVSVNSSPHSQQ